MPRSDLAVWTSASSGYDAIGYDMDDARSPRVLFVYFTFTKQALRVTEDMESVFRDLGWTIERAEIEFTDPRYVKRFERFPFKHRYLDLFRMLPPQLRRATGEIRVPAQAEGGGHDEGRLAHGAGHANNLSAIRYSRRWYWFRRGRWCGSTQGGGMKVGRPSSGAMNTVQSCGWWMRRWWYAHRSTALARDVVPPSCHATT